MKRLLSLFLVLAAVLPALTGCKKNNANDKNPNNTDTPSVTLKVWGAQDDQAILRDMCNAFAQAHPEKKYSFTYGVVGEGDAKKIFLDDPEAAADVFHFANDQIADLVSAGALAQIGGSYRTAVEEENLTGAVDAATVGGKLYAFPATADNGYFLYYNKAVFDQAPNTLAEILSLCTDGRKFAMKVSDSWYLASFFLTAGCTFREDKKIDFNSANGLAAARAVNALCRDPRFVNFGADYDPSIIAGFGDGSVIAAVSGTWNAEKIAAEIGAENLGATKLPVIEIEGVEAQMIGFAGYKLVGVNAGTRYPEDAVKLAAWLTNEENQLKRLRERSMAPANKKAAEDPAVMENPALAALSEQMPYAVSQNNVPASYWVAAEGFGTDLASGSVPDDALQAKLDVMTETVNNPIG
jgi:arabinogalactan oligomer/maltooligosaccharide transport system substrate-binding protein